MVARSSMSVGRCECYSSAGPREMGSDRTGKLKRRTNVSLPGPEPRPRDQLLFCFTYRTV